VNITRNNCESFFLDYYEKNLSPVGVAEVLFFLEENPDLKEVFESYEAIFLEQDKTNFPGKESLKKKSLSDEMESVLSSEINKTNCELFFAASAEGTLSAEQASKLSIFLLQHPELQKEFNLFQKCKLNPDKIVFENKNLLKKQVINVQNREEYFIRSVEKDLDLSEQKQLAAFLRSNPEYKKELEVFKQTILIPEKVSFEFKEELKKKERKPVFVSFGSQRMMYYAAAAAILLLAGIFFIFKNNDSNIGGLANNIRHSTGKVENIKPVDENKPSNAPEKPAPQQKEEVKNNNVHMGVRQNSSVSKNAPAPLIKEEEKTPFQPIILENKIEENPIAKKADEKKVEEAQIQDQALAKNPDTKGDSATAPVVKDQALASAVNTKKDQDQYQTVASIVNKKIRSVLGIKRSTECETSEKIGLWDLAMAAKRGVQKHIGAKTLDVNKVCDGTSGKVEYVFAAGNFEITKNVSR
jgi:hypothetical protein